MSYSRWSSSSRWYTFWSASGAEITQYKWPTQKLKDSQVFEICDIPSYYITYGELKKISRSILLHEIEEHFAKDFDWHDIEIVDGKLERGKPKIIKGKRPTWDQLLELQDYLDQFMRDVDDHFKWNNFFLYEWYYPMRNKLIFKYKKLKEYVKNRSK